MLRVVAFVSMLLRLLPMAPEPDDRARVVELIVGMPCVLSAIEPVPVAARVTIGLVPVPLISVDPLVPCKVIPILVPAPP